MLYSNFSDQRLIASAVGDRRGREGHQKPFQFPSAQYHHIRPHRQQHSVLHPHRPVGQQAEPPPLGAFQTFQRADRVRRVDLLRQHCSQRTCFRHHDRAVADRLGQSISRIQQHRQAEGLFPYGQAGGTQLPPRSPMAGRPPEHQAQDRVADNDRDQQKAQVESGVQHPVFQRQPPSPQELQRQHNAAQGGGSAEKHQKQPEQPGTSAIARQHHQHRRADLAQRMGQPLAARQEKDRGIHGPQQRPQRQPGPGDHFPGDPGRRQQQQIVHRQVQQKEHIYVNYGHGAPPFPRQPLLLCSLYDCFATKKDEPRLSPAQISP